MRKAALIYNPASERKRQSRLRCVEAAAKALESAGVATTLMPTASSGSGGWQAGAAIAAGHDVIFACGGDGTIHDVLQGMVAFGPDVPLGIIPLGTGNVLAHDIGVPGDPVKAIETQLHYSPKRIAAGHVECQSQNGGRESRYFTCMAGVGYDALMIYRASARSKEYFGVMSYLFQGSRLMLFHPYEEFSLELTESSSGSQRTVNVSQATAIRITDFGNFMGRFAPQAALARDDFQSVLVSTGSWFSLISYYFKVKLNKNWETRGIDRVHTTQLNCSALPGHKYAHSLSVQADGECLGGLPAKICIVPKAFTLLLPKRD